MLNKYFKRSEFTCKCGCGFDTVDAELLEVLTTIREHFNKPVIINSACRCAIHNASVGGADNSQHLLGRAADIVVKGIDPFNVYLFINAHSPNALGLGEYKNFTHIDTRVSKARW